MDRFHLRLLSLASVFILATFSGASNVHVRNMQSFIAAVEHLEASNPGLGPLALLQALRKTAGHDDPMTVLYLGASNNLSDVVEPSLLNASTFSFFDKSIHHLVTRHEERGVVLAPDGTTLALAPLLVGIEAGLKARSEGSSTTSIFPLTLGRTLGLSFLSLQDVPASRRLGPDGCWDSVVRPRIFTLSRASTPATDAVIHGGMDGSILGHDLVRLPASEEPPALSLILKRFYVYEVDQDFDWTRHVSPRRRTMSRSILEPLDLQQEVMETLRLVWRLEETEWINWDTEVQQSVREGLEEFVTRYWDCPQIIPRCQWLARSPTETPVALSLPLNFLFLHHTLQPSAPCWTFSSCAEDMRNMQSFHQDQRRWSDIAYNFVVGSDGFIYEGRGWGAVGTHTRGRNSHGYGVSFIGNYTATLPAPHDLDLLRNAFVRCALKRGGLTSDFSLQGHRQGSNHTLCPGDALFAELHKWRHFRA